MTKMSLHFADADGGDDGGDDGGGGVGEGGGRGRAGRGEEHV